MKYLVINEKILNQNDINVDELIFLWKISKKNIKLRNNPDNFIFIQKLESKNMISYKNKDDFMFPSLKDAGKKLLNTLTVDINEKNQIGNIDDIATTLRNKWRGLKPGSMGSLEAIKEKLSKWMLANPQYTPEQIYKAADLYLSKEGSNIKYLQRADYFVYKTENGFTNSRLSAYIDEIDDFEEDGWTNELR